MGTHTIIQRNGYTIADDRTLTFTTCGVCQISHAIPTQMYNRCQSNADEYWYCPNGHYLHFAESDLDRERAARERAERRAADNADTARRWRENAEAEKRQKAAYKGHLTRAKNRIAQGVCPVPGCKRSGFEKVMSHIASEHPDWLHDHPEVKS